MFAAGRTLAPLLVVALVLVPATALAHEIEHVLHRHDGPCGLHVAANHLVMAVAPDTTPEVARVPVIAPALPSSGARPAPPRIPSPARAPPALS
jgi:hypothetical protein